jgi:hypothetical protein
MTDQEQKAREAVRRVIRNLPDLFSKEGNQRFFRSHMEVQDVEFLVAAAREGDKDAVEILREHARGARRTRMNVPDAFHEFVWEWFIDGPPKAKSGSKSKDSELRKQTIALLVKVVSKDYGFSVYRNTEYRGSNSGPPSAISIVAEELGLSERTVEDIWADRKSIVGS